MYSLSNQAASGRRLAVTLALLTGLQIVTSFALQWYLVTKMGLGMHTDAFYAGSTLTQMAAAVVIDTLGAALVPILALCTAEQVRAQGWMLVSVAAAGFAAGAVVLWVVAPLVMPLLVAGFSESGKQLTVSLTRIHLLGLPGAACTAVLTSIYQVRRRFVAPALVTLLSGLGACALVVWRLDDGGITLAAWAQVLALSAPVLVLLPGLGLPHIGSWRFSVLFDVCRRLRPVVLSRVYFLTSTPLDRLLASFLPPGSLVLFELVSRFYVAAQRVLTQGIVAPLLPQLARVAGAGEWEAFRTLYRRQVAQVVILSLLIVAAVETAAIAAIGMVSGPEGTIAGRVTVADLRNIALLAGSMAGLLPCMALSNALNNAYYAQGDTRTPTSIAVAAYTIGVMVKVLGFWVGGVQGLALGVTAWAVFYCAWLYRDLGQHTARAMNRPRGPVATAAATFAVSE